MTERFRGLVAWYVMWTLLVVITGGFWVILLWPWLPD